MGDEPRYPIGFRWSDHRSALWWLGMLYRRPRVLREALEQLPRSRQLAAGFLIWLHVLPYILLVSAAGRIGALSLMGIPWDWASLIGAVASGIAGGIGVGIAVGIVVGIAGGLAFGLAGGIGGGIAFGLAVGIGVGITGGIGGGIGGGIAVGLAVGIGGGIGGGITDGIGVGIGGGIVVGLAVGIGGGIVVGITDGIGVGIGGGIAVGITVGITVLRAYYQIAHPLFVWPTPRGEWYRYHPVAWDDLCSLPFPGLDRLLAAYAEHAPERGRQEIDRLIDSYPSQRTAALRARTRLLGREAASVTDLARLSAIAANLPEGDKGFLRQVPDLRAGIEEISRQQVRLNTLDRPLLREPTALNLLHEIESFRHRIGGFDELLASEFRTAALAWEKIARKQFEESRATLDKQPARQVFRAGDPVDRDAEAFVYRDAVVGQLDQQVTLASGCPGIVLYGRRRVGKSTVLRNLVGFLPETIIPVFLSMQDATAFTSLAHFIDRISGSVPAEFTPPEPAGDLPGLHRYLEACNARLESGNKRLLLALDEYEQIDTKIGQGVFPSDLLPALRESIQSHRRIIWLFAGSHEITELPNAQWTSYLVSARTIEVPPFTPEETRLLLTQPLKHSQLWKEPAERPRFAPEFWGADGIERIHAEADGWPHLVQLIAETAVDVLNAERTPTLTLNPELFERTLDHAIVRGHIVLSQLMEGECSRSGEWEYLTGFRSSDEQSPPTDDAIRRSLRRRQLVREENGRWRLRVPLMARWLRKRG